MRSLFFVILLVMSLTGCSRIGFVVQWADTLILSQLDSNFDLNSEQKEQIRPLVESSWSQIRQEHFPRIANFLETLASDLESTEFSEKIIHQRFEEGQILFRRAWREFEPVGLKLAEISGPDQEKSFLKDFEKDTKKRAEEISTPEKRLRKDRERYERWLDFWVGRLTKEQDQQLEGHIQTHPFPFEEQAKNREKVKNDLLALKPSERVAWVKKSFADPDSVRSEESTAAMKKWREGLQSYLWMFWQSATEKQKKSFDKTLKDRAAELRRLSQK